MKHPARQNSLPFASSPRGYREPSRNLWLAEPLQLRVLEEILPETEYAGCGCDTAASRAGEKTGR